MGFELLPEVVRPHGDTLGAFEPIPGVTVIGFGHRARQGKDSAARAILLARKDAQRFAFADDLYAIARTLHGMTTKDGPLLQRLGIEYRATYGQNVWIRNVYAQLREAQPRPRLALITDVRFPNEMDFIRALGGVTVRVTRRRADGSAYRDPRRDPNHLSEAGLEEAAWDRELVNDEGYPSLLAHRAVELARTL